MVGNGKEGEEKRVVVGMITVHQMVHVPDTYLTKPTQPKQRVTHKASAKRAYSLFNEVGEASKVFDKRLKGNVMRCLHTTITVPRIGEAPRGCFRRRFQYCRDGSDF